MRQNELCFNACCISAGVMLTVTCLLGYSCKLYASRAGMFLCGLNTKQHIMLHLCLTQTWAATWSDSLSETAICKTKQPLRYESCCTTSRFQEAKQCSSQLTRDAAGIVLYCCHVPYSPVQGIPTTLCPSFRDVTPLPSLTTLATPATGQHHSMQIKLRTDKSALAECRESV